MYTRSYSKQKQNAIRAPLPPDYSGTVLSEQGHIKDEGLPESAAPAVTSSAKGITRRPKRQSRPAQEAASDSRPSLLEGLFGYKNDKTHTQEADYRRHNEEETGYREDTYEADSFSEADNSPKLQSGILEGTDNNTEKEYPEPSKSGGLLFPQGVRQDDVLLLGLMLFLYSESKNGACESCKEALVLLALLYLSGL